MSNPPRTVKREIRQPAVIRQGDRWETVTFFTTIDSGCEGDVLNVFVDYSFRE
jgi:hypothetical protein